MTVVVKIPKSSILKSSQSATRCLSAVLLISCMSLSLVSVSPCLGEDKPLLSEGDARSSVWNDAWTETFYGNGTPPFKTVIHSRPQRVWNGSTWIEYEIRSVNDSAVILETPTCAYLVGQAEVLLFRPSSLGPPVGMSKWTVEKYSSELGSWVEETVCSARVACNLTHVWQEMVLADGVCTLYISNSNKQTIVVTTTAASVYRVSWRIGDISASKALLANGLLLDLKQGVARFAHFDFRKLSLWNGDDPVLMLDYDDMPCESYQECELGCLSSGSAYASLTFGDWSLRANESVILDPSSSTFVSEAALDGKITKYGSTYPPNGVSVDTQGNIIVGQENTSGSYYMYRGYVSFNTGPIQDNADIRDAVLKLKTYGDASIADFTLRAMGGSQPIYGNNLTAGAWDSGTTEVATWPSANYPGPAVYVNITVPTGQVNKVGRTQFELRSDREGYAPESMRPEYVAFYSGDSAGSEPILEVTWTPYSIKTSGFEWYYWNSSTNTKAMILLFGGYASQWFPSVLSVQLYDSIHDHCREKYLQFIEGLLANGFNVLTPKQDLFYGTGIPDQERYNASIHNAAAWLRDQGSEYVFLFGHSAGGVIVSWEILADYAGNYSAAIMASAPVYYDIFPWLYQSANNASKAKVCTSFVVGQEDYQLGDIYLQMARYFNNTNVHKEWHKWIDGHDIWCNDNCVTHPGETLLNMTLNWCNNHACILKNPSFEDRLRTVYGSAHWEANDQEWRELKGDFDGDGKCGPADWARLAPIFGTNVLTNKTYDWRCDLNGDGVIGSTDLAWFSPDYGKTATRLAGAYSLYSNGGEYCAWQWFNDSAKLIEGKQLNFSFNFLARDIYSNGTPVEARAEISYQNGTGEYWVNGTWFHPTSNTTWYMLSVTANIPMGATAVKVVIHGRPNFKAWIDLVAVDTGGS